MGLLDDAIREHLELKRLRGADPSDVARLEREALGPVRRGAVGPDAVAEEETLAPPPEPFDAERAGTHPLVDDGQTLIPGSEPSTVGQDTAEIDMQSVIEDEADEPAAAAHPAAEEYPPHAASGESERHEPYAPVEPPAEPEHQEPYAPAASEHDAGEGASEDEDDVLEETPSFLQQTPEHDRLWFEQQPPRDFDFDK